MKLLSRLIQSCAIVAAIVALLLCGSLSFAQTVNYTFTSGSMPGGITFSRASTATYFGADGLMHTAAINAPRFQYVSGTPYYLSEPAATNLLRETNNFAATTNWYYYWPSTVVANQFTAPDGANTGWKLTNPSQNFAVVAEANMAYPGKYTVSVWAKAISGTPNLQLALAQNGAGPSSVDVAPTGTLTRQSYTSPVASVYATAMLQSLFINDVNNSAANLLGLWGPQLEAGGKATSYVLSTGGVQGTRAADVATFTIPGGSTTEMIYTFDDNSTQTVYAVPGTYTIRTDHLNRSAIKTIVSGTAVAPADAPDFLNDTNTYYNAITETLSDYLGGLVTICYTTDGSTPTATAGTCTHGTLYTTPISITANGTVIKAMASAPSGAVSNSAVVSATYTLAIAPPEIDVAAGQVRTGALVTMSSLTQGATILWALNSTPSCPSTGTVFTTPVVISSAATLNVIGCKVGYPASAVVSNAYTVRSPQTFYISSSSGNDSNAGTSSGSPWAHVPGMEGASGTSAATTPVGGDSYLLKVGDTFTASLTVTRSGDSGANILLASYGTGAMPYWTGSNGTAPIMALDMQRGYWTIRGIKFHSTGQYPGMFGAMAVLHGNFPGGPDSLSPEPGWIVETCQSDAQFWLSGPNTIIRNNLLDGSANGGTTYGSMTTGAQNAAIVISGVAGGKYAQVYGNEVRYFTGRGIWMEEGASYNTIHDNYVHHMESEQGGGFTTAFGVDLDGAGTPEYGNIAYNNHTYYIHGSGIALENQQDASIYSNSIHDVDVSGIASNHYTGGSFGSTEFRHDVANNLMYNNVMWNLWHCGGAEDESGNMFVHNTCVKGTRPPWGDLADRPDGWTASSSIGGTNFGETFVDNIIVGFDVPVSAPAGAFTQFDYNDLYGTGTTVYSNGSNKTLAQTVALGLMTHGISSDPQFANAPLDLSLKPISPARHTGVTLSSPVNTVLAPSSFPWITIPEGLQPNMGAFGEPIGAALWFSFP